MAQLRCSSAMAQHTTLSCSKLQPPPPSMAASLSRRLPGSAQRRLGRPQRCARLVARSSSSGGDRRPAAAAAAAAPAGSGSGGWRTFWAAVDTSAWLGTVGTALAFRATPPGFRIPVDSELRLRVRPKVVLGVARRRRENRG